MDHTNQIVELFVGYSYLDKDNHQIKANCSSTLVKGESKLILFDTLTPWDCEVLLKELKRHHAKPEDINYVVCSHGHSDHIGNLNLFLNAEHFVGSCRSFKHIYYCHDFDEKPYMLDKNIEVISTPGHTAACVSLIVRNTNLGHHASIALVGDLFEREEDIFDESIWIAAGSEMESVQRKNRSMIADMVDFICPGHGPHFKVTDEMREKLRDDMELD